MPFDLLASGEGGMALMSPCEMLLFLRRGRNGVEKRNGFSVNQPGGGESNVSLKKLTN